MRATAFTRNSRAGDEGIRRLLAHLYGGSTPAAEKAHDGPEERMRQECTCECGASQEDDFIRLPGLFRRWELQDVVEADADFHIETAGHSEDGTELFAVYRREHLTPCPKED